MKRPGGNWLQRLGLNTRRWVWPLAAVAVIAAVIAVAVTTGKHHDNNTASSSATTGVGVPTTTPELTGPGVTPSVVSSPTTVPPPPTTVPGVTGPTVVTAASEVPTIPPTAPPATNEVPGIPVGTIGNRANPVSPGTVADIGGGWRLQVLNVDPDAAAAIAAVNQFNHAPPAGKSFTLVTVAAGYFGLEDPKSAFETTISAVGASNVELPAECGVVPQELDSFGELFSGGVVVGNVCFVTAPDDVASLQLYASGTLSGDKVFLDAATSPKSAVPMTSLVGPQPGAAATPSRLAPTPLGTPAQVGDGWKLTVTSAASDITDSLMAENQFRDPPPAGYRFFGVGVTYEYGGAGSASAFNVGTNAVGASNVALSTDCGFFSTQIDLTADVFSGGSVSGTICFVVPSSSPLMVIFASAVLNGANVTFATS
ncbi:MAG TPA: hypothetical protein VHN36_12425 [Ilumatobacteraceae bacterium]|nr:hypothetical protein [Ilumatobacteraceae bacterium]